MPLIKHNNTNTIPSSVIHAFEDTIAKIKKRQTQMKWAYAMHAGLRLGWMGDDKKWDLDIAPLLKFAHILLRDKKTTIGEFADFITNNIASLENFDAVSGNYKEIRNAYIEALEDFAINHIRPALGLRQKVDWDRARLLFLAHKNPEHPIAKLPVELVRNIAAKSLAVPTSF